MLAIVQVRIEEHIELQAPNARLAEVQQLVTVCLMASKQTIRIAQHQVRQLVKIGQSQKQCII